MNENTPKRWHLHVTVLPGKRKDELRNVTKVLINWLRKDQMRIFEARHGRERLYCIDTVDKVIKEQLKQELDSSFFTNIHENEVSMDCAEHRKNGKNRWRPIPMKQD